MKVVRVSAPSGHSLCMEVAGLEVIFGGKVEHDEELHGVVGFKWGAQFAWGRNGAKWRMLQ